MKYCKTCERNRRDSSFRKLFDKRYNIEYMCSKCLDCERSYGRKKQFAFRKTEEGKAYRKKRNKLDWQKEKLKPIKERAANVWRNKNNERHTKSNRARASRNQKKHIDSVSDSYVSKLITKYLGIPSEEITKELIEIKRIQILILREL